MKHIAILFIFLTTFAKAQTEKGKFMLGANISDFSYNVSSKTLQLSLSPQIGYFVARNIAIGSKFQLSTSTTSVLDANGNTRTVSNGTGYAIEPFLRMYTEGEKVKFFIEPSAGYYYISGTSAKVTDVKTITFAALAGVTIFPAKGLGIDFGASYRYINYGGGYSLLGLSIGLKGFFGKN